MYYLIDPTFHQFFNEKNPIPSGINQESLEKILNLGYCQIDKISFIDYLKEVSKKDDIDLLVDTISLDQLYFSNEKSNKI